MIEAHEVPAPGPIEQRWTASSRAPLSPAYSADPADVFSWVGIIMYLPAELTDGDKSAIRGKFEEYCGLLQPLFDEYGAVPHWAKVEVDAGSREHQRRVVRSLQNNYNLSQFNLVRSILDPHGVLMNNKMQKLLCSTNS